MNREKRGETREQKLVFWIIAILTIIVAVFLLTCNANAASAPKLDAGCLPSSNRDTSRTAECRAAALALPDYCRSFLAERIASLNPLKPVDGYLVHRVTCAAEGLPLTCFPDIINGVINFFSNDAINRLCKEYDRLINCAQGTTILYDACMDPRGGVWGILNLILHILTWGVGIIAVLGFVIAAIIYTTAGGDESKTKLAKTMMFNIVIGLILYVLLHAFINFILPGDVMPSSECQELQDNGATRQDLKDVGCIK
ncbi:MAG: pilin [Candidatus Nomurabacteria bacterium]|nr:pilin [Candidatus Nomurabacteria bacterium]